MAARNTRFVALTIAGSDSGGGAGIQADLKTFAALGVHGTSAIACLTAQNPARVLGIEPCPPTFLRRQIEAVFEELPPRAVKTGMLGTAGNIRAVAEMFTAKSSRQPVPLVVDPVMVSTSGARLLPAAAERVLRDRLLPLANLVTPNLSEAEVLAELRIRHPEDLRLAARKIHGRFGCAVLAKGGHLPDTRAAIDIFFDGKMELLLQAPFVRGISTHGTGCTYSAAICAALARGARLPDAVAIAKEFITQAIAGSYRVGDYFALDLRPLTPAPRWPARSGR
jgi:hydroxymethylpyrimidine/phosphomethylpyrimidine kinase